MFHLPNNRRLWIGVAGAGILIVAGILAVNVRRQEAAHAQNQPVKQVAAPKKATAPKPVKVSTKATQPAQMVTVPKGTSIIATMGQTLASDKAQAGDSFAARVSTPVEVDGKTVIPKGASVTGRVVKVKKHEIKVALASVTVGGKSYDLETNSVRPTDKDQIKQNASTASASQDANTNKDVATLASKTQLTFKLAKPVTVPVKG